MRPAAIARSLIFPLFALLVSNSSSASAQPHSQSWAAVDQALGCPGTTQPDGVRRYGFARSDLPVLVDDVPIKPALALGGWLAFQPMGRGALVMGDLVLTQEEVNPVLAALLRGAIHVTAIHNHLLRASPATIYMHVEGRGDPARLAAALRTGLAASHIGLAAPPPATTPVAMESRHGRAGFVLAASWQGQWRYLPVHGSAS